MKPARGWPSQTEGPKAPDAATEARIGAMFRKAMSYAEQLGMPDDMRYELSAMLPGMSADADTSWKALNEKQLHDLLCMLEGFIYITFLKENANAA